jgi:hypothetical protein
MDKKELKKKYLENKPEMGVFKVINRSNGKIFIDSGLNVNGKVNACKFQLKHGSHMNKLLQEDFKKFGEDNFTFEIVDILEPKEDESLDYKKELTLLEEMWIENLQSYGEKGYNKLRVK